jgi:UDP-3-O-[3-hydroxymyristoyl] glucosamine N-acyltransferase
MSHQPVTLGELAELVGGRVQGDPATTIENAAVLADVGPGQITFVDKPERLRQLAQTQATAVVVSERITTDWAAAIYVNDVHAAFSKIVRRFRPPREAKHVGVSPRAIVSSSAWIGSNVNIHPGATVDDDCEFGDDTTILPGAHILAGCIIGRGVTIGPGAVLYESTIIGDYTTIHAGVVIGCHGFGYSQAGGRHMPAAQLGNVRIGDHVEIGACTTIDRGTYGSTTIGDGTKIDNLVQIAHNCRIGRHNLICSQVGIAGSSSTGDYVVIGGQAGLRDHVHIGAGSILSAMAGITNDVPEKSVMMGIPATPEREQKLKQAALAKLPEMRKEFKELRTTVAELQRTAGLDARSGDRSGRAA